MSSIDSGQFIEGEFLPLHENGQGANKEHENWWTSERVETIFIDATVTTLAVGGIILTGGTGILAAISIIGATHSSIKLTLDLIVPSKELKNISDGMSIAAPIGRYGALFAYSRGGDKKLAILYSSRAETAVSLVSIGKDISSAKEASTGFDISEPIAALNNALSITTSISNEVEFSQQRNLQNKTKAAHADHTKFQRPDLDQKDLDFDEQEPIHPETNDSIELLFDEFGPYFKSSIKDLNTSFKKDGGLFREPKDGINEYTDDVDSIEDDWHEWD